jgi:predicted O-methyltransferase YrrM
MTFTTRALEVFKSERPIATRIYQGILRRTINGSYRFCEKLGFHPVLTHFYQPIPDSRTLGLSIWQKRYSLDGLNFDAPRQLALLQEFRQWKSEYDSFPFAKPNGRPEYFVNNGSFESVDGEVLYCMIRKFKPRRIIEIGAGYSTYVSAQAAAENSRGGAPSCEHIAIDPYASESLLAGLPKATRVVRQKVEEVPFAEFETLGQNDVLFIDSSHVVRIGGDVTHEYLEILPRLKKGVVIHCHDIYLPAEYPQDLILRDHNFWTEQYLLHAFLLFNQAFEVLWAGSYMHLEHPDLLSDTFASYRRGSFWPMSFWIRKIS